MSATGAGHESEDRVVWKYTLREPVQRFTMPADARIIEIGRHLMDQSQDYAPPNATYLHVDLDSDNTPGGDA